MPQIPAQPLATPRFRLVGHHNTDGPTTPTQHRAAVRKITQENHAAATLSPFDARLIFAQQVAANLEGGRAAILRPDRRQSLITQAKRLGLRPFDAHLVIAIVQEASQRGDFHPGQAAPHDSAHVHASLTLVAKPTRGQTQEAGSMLVWSLVIASAILIVLLILFSP